MLLLQMQPCLQKCRSEDPYVMAYLAPVLTSGPFQLYITFNGCWAQNMYLFLPHSLPLVNHAADALAALLFLGSQLPQAHRGFGPLTLLDLCFWDLSMQEMCQPSAALHQGRSTKVEVSMKGKDGKA